MKKPTLSTITTYLVVILLLLNPALLIWQHFGMTRVIEISPRHPHGARVTDDRESAKGDSVSSLERTADAFIMRCQLGSATFYPFCKFQFLMGDATKGLDVSQFDTIAVDMRYSGRPPRLVKLHLLNFEPTFPLLATGTRSEITKPP